jgi:predicted permease
VVTEVALAVVALIGAGLFLRSLHNAQQINPGFESKNLFEMRFDLASVRYDQEHGQQFFREAIQRAKSVPGVVDAAVSANGIFASTILGTVYREGEQVSPENRGTLVNLSSVTPDHFDTLRIPLLRGRDFTEFDSETTKRVIIVNEAMAKLVWPDEEAVGKRIVQVLIPTPLEVVGVVGTSVVNAVGENPQPVAYFPMKQQYVSGAWLLVRTTGRAETVLSTVRSQVQQLERNLALTNVQTIEEVLGVGLWAPRMGAALLGLFGLLALVLASIGIYGVLAYSVAQRTAEIGIRMALGAQQQQMFALVLKHGMSLAAIGAGVGIVTALLGVAVLACYVPARRATRVDPIVALRFE